VAKLAHEIAPGPVARPGDSFDQEDGDEEKRTDDTRQEQRTSNDSHEPKLDFAIHDVISHEIDS
jgi:hypothetical protein